MCYNEEKGVEKMEKKLVEEFKAACREYFSRVSLSSLRVYGRSLQLQKPTTKNKNELIEDILSVLIGEVVPKRNNTGAPIKDFYLNEQIIEDINEFREKFFGTELPVLPPIVTQEEQEETPSITKIQFVLNFNDLTYEQKEKLKIFLDSLTTVY